MNGYLQAMSDVCPRRRYGRHSSTCHRNRLASRSDSISVRMSPVELNVLKQLTMLLRYVSLSIAYASKESPALIHGLLCTGAHLLGQDPSRSA